MRSRAIIGTAAAAAMLALAGGAAAKVTFNGETGTGSVGSHDVRKAFGWSERTFKRHADDVRFASLVNAVAEVGWTCHDPVTDTYSDGGYTETSTSRQPLASALVLKKRKVTGFSLTGFAGEATTLSSTVDPPSGPDMLNDPCPGEEIVQPPSAHAGETYTLQVSDDGGASWTALSH